MKMQNIVFGMAFRIRGGEWQLADCFYKSKEEAEEAIEQAKEDDARRGWAVSYEVVKFKVIE